MTEIGTDWQDSRPLYLRYAADLRAKIMSGDLEGQLPSVSQLMVNYSSNSISVIQRAIDVLAAEGFVTKQQGKGNFVRAGRVVPVEAVAYIDPADGKRSYELLDVNETVPPADVAAALGVGPAEVAQLRKQLGVLSSRTPLELVWNYYPVEFARGTPLAMKKRVKGGAKSVLADRGLQARWKVDEVTTRAPVEEEVSLLRLPEGVPVMRTLRTITTGDGRPVEVSVIVKGGHLYALRHRSEIS